MFKWFMISVAFFVPISVFSQNLNGIWKGFFTTGFGDNKQYYKYEAQIVLDGSAGNILSGISYSYLNTTFYGKSQLDGHYNPATKKLDLQEVRLVSFSSTNRSNVCLMHCTLSYFKIENEEILEGIFSSSNSVTGADCGQGYIRLERSRKSDFSVEPFLSKAKPAPAVKHQKTAKPNTPQIIAKNNKGKASEQTNVITANPSDSGEATAVKKENAVEKENKRTTAPDTEHSDADGGEAVNPVLKSFSSIPEYFQKRKNKLIRTIITHTPEVDINFYDNGEVDDDSITVYHNLTPIIQHGRLSQQSIDYGFDASDNNRLQSFIIVADNLGKIPPNSALMVIYTNNERYEIFIESDMNNNAEVRIVYEPVKK